MQVEEVLHKMNIRKSIVIKSLSASLGFSRSSVGPITDNTKTGDVRTGVFSVC